MAYPYDGTIMYGASFPPFPDVRYVPTDSPPIPHPCPASSTDQEIGALKHRVGLLEKQMRELTAKFLAKGKRGKKR